MTSFAPERIRIAAGFWSVNGILRKRLDPRPLAILLALFGLAFQRLADFNDNEAWPYFDTFNLHHYEPLQNYPKLYADFRAQGTLRWQRHAACWPAPSRADAPISPASLWWR